ncbi:hypothetical protein [Flammeovirga aprica]|uniref:Uncharacterized protein n=1 Tax=Flammeovirga aprica JL-4 TaxID=694437 RepID=A0A7X9P141_9BACT|nr:hypothetical protein [Flammeovirga aprica]NME67510.1 hypothetical protein [Flammeovirga aprica JL-4]
MKNKSVYQDCPNCWGYQEYNRDNVREQETEQTEEQYNSRSLFKISGADVEEDDVVYKA